MFERVDVDEPAAVRRVVVFVAWPVAYALYARILFLVRFLAGLVFARLGRKKQDFWRGPAQLRLVWRVCLMLERRGQIVTKI